MHKESLAVLIFLTLSSECCDYRQAPPHSVPVVLGIELSSVHARQVLYQLSYTPGQVQTLDFFFMEELYIQGIEDAINKPSVRWL